MTKSAYKKTGAAGWFAQKDNLGKLAAHGNPLQRPGADTDFELFRGELERGMLNTCKASRAGQKALVPVIMLKSLP